MEEDKKVGSVGAFMAEKIEPAAVNDEVSQWFDQILCDQYVEHPMTALFAPPGSMEAPPETQEADLFRAPEEPAEPLNLSARPSGVFPPNVLLDWCIPLNFFKNVLTLLRQVYVGVPRGNWSIKVPPAQKDKRVFLSLKVDDQYEVRINFSKDASTAMLVDHKPGLGVHVRSIERMALRNDCWSDFEGWVNLSKSTLNRLWEEAEGREPPKTG